MMVWIHEDGLDADVLINSDFVSSVERDQFETELFHIRMVNGDSYMVRDKESAAWLTMRE